MIERFVGLVTFAGGLAALTLDQALTWFVGAAAIATGLAVGSSKRKDSMISDLEKSEARKQQDIDGLERRVTSERDRRHQERDRRHECEKKISGLERELATIREYSAPEASKAIIKVLAELRMATTTGFSSQGELILKNTELAAGAVTALEQLHKDLERLHEDLVKPG